MPPKPTPQTVADYIANAPAEVQARLKKLRQTIRQAAPEATETIKYQMPTFVLGGNLLSFGVYKTHIGLYPLPAGSQKFQKALAPYRAAKSTARFPLDQPLPYALITELVKYRVKEQTAKARAKAKP